MRWIGVGKKHCVEVPTVNVLKISYPGLPSGRKRVGFSSKENKKLLALGLVLGIYGFYDKSIHPATKAPFPNFLFILDWSDIMTCFQQ